MLMILKISLLNSLWRHIMTNEEKEVFWNSVPDSLREDIMELIEWGIYTEEEAINKLIKEGF